MFEVQPFKSYSLTRQRLQIGFVIILLIPATLSILHLATLRPGPSYLSYVQTGLVTLRQNINQNFCDTGTKLGKEHCLASSIDYTKNDVSVCRIFTHDWYRDECYSHYSKSWETFINHWAGIAIFMFILGLMMLGTIITDSNLIGFSVIVGIMIMMTGYIIVDVVTKNDVCYPNCMSPLIAPSPDSFWSLLYISIFAFIGLAINYYYRTTE